MTESNLDFTIQKLGECRFSSPVSDRHFLTDNDLLLYHSQLKDFKPYSDMWQNLPAMELAGPRDKIFFDPNELNCGIVTCGGLCPGLNDVVRAVVMELHYGYGVKKVLGFRYGYEGLVEKFGHIPAELTPQNVSRIHEMGGTILGSSRGNQDPCEMVDRLQALKIGVLFTLGGDGTLRGAHAIYEEITRRGLNIAVIGIPKTIDNDISFVQKTFGLETAVSEARRFTYAAHSEATGARNGIGLVKLMGRDSGFIAAYTSLADSQVNFCLVPESVFTLEGFLKALQKRIEAKGHAVILVAEGAGQDLIVKDVTRKKDMSGNILHEDIGGFLRDEIKAYFKEIGVETSVKYIDPSYTIRSMPANAHDSAFCLLLGHAAVHAGMSGRTDMMVGSWKGEATHIPISLAISKRKKIDLHGWLWETVLASTGQPRVM
ncbi:MAG TPA: ATP-dependent 6-phosphofructokinase [Candidatus Omnitrophota bacterium]|nr:ATP-dependent 6-phosphofructokinase [Candidatus Omnitrophota bacterium]